MASGKKREESVHEMHDQEIRKATETGRREPPDETGEKGETAGPETAEQDSAKGPDDLETLLRELEETHRLAEDLQKENESLRNAAARAAADLYNYRKRIERETEQAKQRLAARTAESLLPVLDNFDRALDSVDPKDPSALKKGVEMVRDQFFGVLQQLGVEPIEAGGKPFDPALHEAVAVEEAPHAPDGTIIEEFQRGFLIGGKVLRASKVKVAGRMGQGGQEESEKKEG